MSESKCVKELLLPWLRNLYPSYSTAIEQLTNRNCASFRKLYFANFLDAILELAVMIHHDEEPINALTQLLSSQILGLFDQTPGALSTTTTTTTTTLYS